jgi:20S proteasome alpha/beta subunit
MLLNIIPHAKFARARIQFAAKNGVVIATDRKVSSVLVDSEEYQKIQNITPTTGERL